MEIWLAFYYKQHIATRDDEGHILVSLNLVYMHLLSWSHGYKHRTPLLGNKQILCGHQLWDKVKKIKMLKLCINYELVKFFVMLHELVFSLFWFRIILASYEYFGVSWDRKFGFNKWILSPFTTNVQWATFIWKTTWSACDSNN